VEDWQEICRTWIAGLPSAREIGGEKSGVSIDHICYVQVITSPLGDMLAICDDQWLHLLEFCDLVDLPKKIKKLQQKIGADFHFIAPSSKAVSNAPVSLNRSHQSVLPRSSSENPAAAFENAPRSSLTHALERFPKSGNRFLDKKRGENKKLEHSAEPSEAKTALEQFPKVKTRFSDKNCDQNKELELSIEPSEIKTALGNPSAGLLCVRVQAALDDYFAGRNAAFSIPCALHGTDFSITVWRALQQIPVGESWSYAKQAAFIGRPTACRAVAHANSRNQIAVIIPCHRVIGSDGRLTGYAGGLPRKEWLLAHEKRYFSA